MKFSLIVPTINRKEQLDRLLDSLKRQDHRDFEVFVVDQNPEGRLEDILARYRDHLPLTHIWTPTPGAARARNLGLKQADGDMIAFPDDDCWYPDGLLTRVIRYFDENPELDGVFGKTVDETGADSANVWSPDSVLEVTRQNIWTSSIAAAAFFKLAVTDRVGLFDEDMGVGAGTKWGACEETDFIVRGLDLGFTFRYDPSIIVHHPQVITGFDDRAIARALSYGRGQGYVLRKQRFPLKMIARFLIRPAGGAVLSLLTGRWNKMRYHLAAFRGRLSGLRG